MPSFAPGRRRKIEALIAAPLNATVTDIVPCLDPLSVVVVAPESSPGSANSYFDVREMYDNDSYSRRKLNPC